MSKSKEKCSQRSRINSSLNGGYKKEIMNVGTIEDVGLKQVKKKINTYMKCDTSKIIKAHKL